MKTILIGTTNPSKLASMRNKPETASLQCVSPMELQLSLEPAEDARTAEGNALQKAIAWHQASDLPVFTEDSGLVLLDLPPDHPDQPGVAVRRVNGYAMTDDEMLQWYRDLAQRHGGQLRAVWQDAYCLLADETHYATHADSIENLAAFSFILTDHPCDARKPGWPLDSLTTYPGAKRYKAEMTREELQRVYEKQSAGNSAALMRELQEWMKIAAHQLHL